MERKFRVFNIQWDFKDEEDIASIEAEESDIIEYPSTTMEVIVTDDDVEDIYDQEEIEDYISDYIIYETAFFHGRFDYEEI